MSLNQYIRPVRTKLLHISFIRNISITQSSINTTIKNDESISKTTTTIPENIQQAKELAGYRALEIPEFKTLGSAEGTTATATGSSSSSSSSSILSINVPPSVPVYIRRGSLLSIYGIQEISSIDSVRSQLQFPNFWKRLIYGGYVSGYQKLISTTPFSLLISSKSRSSGSGGGSGSGSGFEKLFVNLVLDGTTDWAILDKSALQVYTGNSLSITMHKLPKFISKKLSRSLKKDKKSKTNTNKLETGLFSWKKLGYTLLSGRGKVGLVGNGSSSGYGSSIYNINLNQNEEILINKNNLLGITVNGPYDLQNCIVKYEFPIINNANPTNTNINIKEPVTIVKPKLIQPTTWNLIVLKLKNFNNGFKKIFQIINKYTLGLKTTSYNYLAGNQDFIKVIGPRNLLLQSNTNKSHRGFYNIIPRNKPQAKVWPTNQTTTKVDESSSFSTPKDYLNYVTIEPGKGAVFKSTLDFSETVESIENKNKNKNKSK